MGNETSTLSSSPPPPPRILKDLSLSSVSEYISSEKCKRIVVLTGAGISTSAGIPDFRSPDTGLYANLSRLNLPYPEAVFDISFFRQNPQPFYMLARELYPGKFMPTLTHAFVALLARKEQLHLCVTQNIDTLERRAGVPEDKLVEAHGSFVSQRCIECHTPFPNDEMEACVASATIPHCKEPECTSEGSDGAGGLVKPDIVFFGEALPAGFGEARLKVQEADLCIIMGTSLSVWPFAGLSQICGDDCVRLLINQESVGGLGSRREDVVWLGGCDEGVEALCRELGWVGELKDLWKEVGGKPTLEDEAGIPDTRTKEEKVEDEVEKLTREVERGLEISGTHEKLVRGELSMEKGISKDKEDADTGGKKAEDHEEKQSTPDTGLVADKVTSDPSTQAVEDVNTSKSQSLKS